MRMRLMLRMTMLKLATMKARQVAQTSAPIDETGAMANLLKLHTMGTHAFVCSKQCRVSE